MIKIIYVLCFIIFLPGCIQQGITETPIQNDLTQEQLKLEFLYADGCEEFCLPALLIVKDMEDEIIEEQLIVKYINLTERHTNPEIMKIQEEYKDMNKIQGVPAYALHKNNETYFYTGYLEKSALIDWICQHYDIKPDICLN
ncbi:hypothetical protein KO317_00210 [Candidatus Micrarchaeota archaeon]|nr:hypothetical protein [Candidatus Micrarchaeota archaeon]